MFMLQATRPMFISNMNINSYHEYYNTIISYLVMSLRNEYETCSDAVASLGNTMLRGFNHFDSNLDELFILRER